MLRAFGLVLLAALMAAPAAAQEKSRVRPGQGQGQQGQGQNQGQPRQQQPQGLGERANAAYNAGRYAEAAELYRQILELREQRLGDEAMPTLQVMSRLGVSLIELGRFDEAEMLMRRAVAAAEQAGGDNAGVATALNGLGAALRRQGRGAEAEQVLRRALAIREAVLGPDHPEVAGTLFNLAQAIAHGSAAQSRSGEAEALLRRSAAIRAKAFGPDHSLVALTNNAITVLLRNTGRAGEAESLARATVASQEARLGREHPRVAQALYGLGVVELAQRRYDAAEAAFRRSAAIREKALGADHPDLAQSLGNLAFALAQQQRGDEALAAIRQATAIHVRRREADDQRGDDTAEGERRTARWLFARHVGIAHLVGSKATPEQRIALSREAFEMQQRAQTGGVGNALARMAARFAAGQGPMAPVVRERQDAQARRQAIDRSLIEAVARPTGERDRAAEDALRAERTRIDQRLDALDARLAKEFPQYAELTSAKPLGIPEVRALLAPDEAMAVYLVRDDDAFLWLIRKDRVQWRRLATDRNGFDQAVKALRQRLDPATNPRLEPVPLDATLSLYRLLLPDAEQNLAGIKHLIVVPDGPLQSLPFGVLTTAPPDTKDGGKGPTPWLIRDHALSVLPTVASLRALRAEAGTSKEREPFVGFGDPEGLRGMEPLPESADELRALARAFKAPPASVKLRAAATETAVKAAPLQRYRVVAFATHGLMAGEFGDNAEPALVLSPPRVPTPDDDGMLTASEVAQLRLDADWVILSACNTAAPDGTPGAEGLSGLAKAFFYAGARSLLVSHWAVASDAAVRLTTGAVGALEKAPGIGRAEALRRSMVALLDDRTDPQMAHPMFWAPFVLVGEGGRERVR